MSTRAALLTTLASGSLARLATPLRVPLTDTETGIAEALDNAFAALGIPGDTTTLTLADSLLPAARALARYYTLVLLYTAAGAGVDTQEATGAGQADPGLQARPAAQRFRQIGLLLAEAKDRAAALGYPILATAQPLQLGRLNLDFLTPPLPIRGHGGW